jgi:hypothetical protein
VLFFKSSKENKKGLYSSVIETLRNDESICDSKCKNGYGAYSLGLRFYFFDLGFDVEESGGYVLVYFSHVKEGIPDKVYHNIKNKLGAEPNEITVFGPRLERYQTYEEFKKWLGEIRRKREQDKNISPEARSYYGDATQFQYVYDMRKWQTKKDQKSRIK